MFYSEKIEGLFTSIEHLVTDEHNQQKQWTSTSGISMPQNKMLTREHLKPGLYENPISYILKDLTFPIFFLPSQLAKPLYKKALRTMMPPCLMTIGRDFNYQTSPPRDGLKDANILSYDQHFLKKYPTRPFTTTNTRQSPTKVSISAQPTLCPQSTTSEHEDRYCNVLQ